jgi:hypothetical protein
VGPPSLSGYRAWGNRPGRVYELFINRLRHPYELCPMLTSSMIGLQIHRTRLFASTGRGVLRRFYSQAPAPPERRPKGDDMCALAFVHRKAQARAKPRVAARRALKRAQVVGAAASLFGSVASGVFGAVFSAASWFVANEGARKWLSTIGATMLFLTIPLLIIGGYCMDWLEKDKPQRGSKVARYDEDDNEEY